MPDDEKDEEEIWILEKSYLALVSITTSVSHKSMCTPFEFVACSEAPPNLFTS